MPNQCRGSASLINLDAGAVPDFGREKVSPAKNRKARRLTISMPFLAEERYCDTSAALLHMSVSFNLFVTHI